MTIPEVTKTMILDTYSVACDIENQLGAYLRRPLPGIYLPGQTNPVMIPGNLYYTRCLRSGRETLVTALEQAVSDIFDINHQLVVSNAQLDALKNQTAQPTVALEVVRDVVESVIIDLSQWLVERNRHAKQDFLLKHLKCEMLHPNNEMILVWVLRQIELLTTDIRRRVADFIDQDDWVMHFQKSMGRDTFVEKTIDFRIYDWHRKMEEGTWQHKTDDGLWQRKVEAGLWHL